MDVGYVRSSKREQGLSYSARSYIGPAASREIATTASLPSLNTQLSVERTH